MGVAEREIAPGEAAGLPVHALGGNFGDAVQHRPAGAVEAAPLAGDEVDVPERYYRYFPASRGYHGTHDFSFYVLEPVRLRYIGGFGNIRWIAPEELLEANPFSAQAEAAILEHMNEDHGDALRHYCRSGLGLDTRSDDDVTMVGIDGEGFDVGVGEAIHRLSFEGPVTNAGEARAALVAMAR